MKQTAPLFKTKVEYEYIPQPTLDGEENLDNDEFVVYLA